VSDNRCLVLAAGSAEEKDKWMEDIRITVAAAAERADVDTAAKIIYPSLKSNSEYRNMLIDMLCTSVFS